MTLEQKIAECNRDLFPLRGFIELSLPKEQCFDVISSVSTKFDEFPSTVDFLHYVINNLNFAWLEREYTRLLHPTVLALLNSDWDMCDWYTIMLEWPHVSMDGERLAYTRNAAAGVQDRQTVTSIGKYLARHFSALPANVLRDAAALFTPDKFEIWDTTEDIVRGVQEGPTSCMKWSGHTDVETHPYSCYTPQNGWTLAVRIANDQIDGRCLCHTKGDKKIFVRSFKRDPNDGYSHSDVALEAWLKSQGYTHTGGWRSYCQIDTKGSILFPYIDGDCQHVNDNDFIDENGDYECDNTDGTATTRDNDDRNYCQSCDCHENDGTWTGRRDDHWVCYGCMDNYTYVKGQNGNEYYIHDNDVVTVGDQNYDEEFLADNNIVELADGDYADLDDAVCIDGDYYLSDDDDVTYFADEYHLISDVSTVKLHEVRPRFDEEYAHVDDTWTCADTGYVYHDDTEHVVINDETYHPDSDFAKQYNLELEPS